ncbi:MAG: histone deacetylase [archaeon]|nr:histone deacetylase [archaeon]
MKPIRIKMAHQLIVNYGLYRKMEVYEPHFANFNELTNFHSPPYINYLEQISANPEKKEPNSQQFSVGETDCPAFSGVLAFSQISAGGSIDGARLLTNDVCDIAINWGGGLHHAKKVEASGFCYVNDIVLGILELLRKFSRALYIDIDVHHGDGVEEAFYLTNRCMTLSLHRFGDFFPGTGSITDIGEEEGTHYAMNVPLKKGIDDDSYIDVFGKILEGVNNYYRPDVIVMQCGADSINQDKLGDFNMTLRGHGECVKMVKSLNLPLLLLGGGGYTIENVSRCWTYETGLILGEEIQNEMPITDYYNKYGPDYKLHIPKGNIPNLNEKKFLEECVAYNLESLKCLEAVPIIDDNLPKDYLSDLAEYEKGGEAVLTRKRDRPNEFDDSGSEK